MDVLAPNRKNMDKDITLLIQKNVIRDIQIKLLEQRQEGQIINEKIINEILFNLEDSYENTQPDTATA